MIDELKIVPEEELILELCRLKFSGANLERIKALIPLVKKWDLFTKLVNNHGVAALASHNLERNSLQTGIPAEVLSYLKNAHMMSLSRNTFNSETTGEILRHLKKAGIKTVILKGLALENSVYGNSGLRQMSDIDILIDRVQCIEARKILMENGFVSLPLKSLFHKPILVYTGKHLPSLIRNGASVEIHHELFSGRDSSLTKLLFNSSYEATVSGEKAWFPAPQVFFLYLVKHLRSHEMNNESQLRLYTDLIVLIEKHYNEILNTDLLILAAGAGMAEILASHLLPLRDLWGINFPEPISDNIDKWKNQNTIDKFVFFLGSPKNNPSNNKSENYRQIINDIPGLHRKILYVTGDLFPSFPFMKNRYRCNNTLKALLYYPHRTGKILWLFRTSPPPPAREKVVIH